MVSEGKRGGVYLADPTRICPGQKHSLYVEQICSAGERGHNGLRDLLPFQLWVLAVVVDTIPAALQPPQLLLPLPLQTHGNQLGIISLDEQKLARKRDHK